MAIILKQQQKKTNWFALLTFVFLLAVIFGGAYFLFFASSPGIEIIAPASFQSTAELSRVEFDPSQIISNPTLKTLRQYGNLPNVGNLGRDNPFLGF